jgi:outer membrane receptor protein involved in Fe transport
MLSTLAMSAMQSGTASAAEAPAAPAETPSAAGQGTAIGEVIVTAQRRNEDVKKVPASISVLGGAVLQEGHITDFEDISRAVPGVSFGAGGGPGTDVIEVRGVSSTSGSATVGVYLDEVPITVRTQGGIAPTGAVEPKLFDMDRVEILRGPQGTLYGASSEGGAIRFLSNQPNLNDFSLSVSSEGSGTVHGGANYEEQVVVNQPFANGHAALRTGFDIGHLSGWIDNLGCCGTSIPGVPVTDTPQGQLIKKGVNDEQWEVGRISLKWAVNSTLTITPALFAEWDHSGDTSVYYPQVGLYQQEKEVPEPIDNRILVGSVTVTNDFKFAQLSSITSYFLQHLDRGNDGTYYNSVYVAQSVIPPSPGNPYGYNNPNTYLIGQLPSPQPSKQRTEQFSQEIRLTSAPSETSKFSWVVGGFFSHQSVNYYNYTFIQNFVQEFESIYGVNPTNSPIAGFTGENFPNNLFAIFIDYFKETQYAAYGDVTYSPISALKFTAGVRESYATGSLYQGLPALYFNEGAPLSQSAVTHSNSVIPKFSVDFDATRDVTLYASVGQGDRLGGENYFVSPTVCGEDLHNIGLTGAPASYNPDSLWSYEGGIKGRFFGNSLSINADAFYLQWHNLQQTINLPICGATVIVNIGDAVSYGPELEVNYRPITGLTLGLTYAYTHAAISRINAQDVTLGLTVGQAILNVPEWMASLRADYNVRLTDDVKVFIRGDYDFTGPSHGEFTASSPDYEQPEYEVMNGSVGMDYKNYVFSIFAKNLLNSSKIIQIPSLLFTPEAYTLRPLTVGVLVKAKF